MAFWRSVGDINILEREAVGRKFLKGAFWFGANQYQLAPL